MPFEEAIDVFREAVDTRNKLVHSHLRPAVFSPRNIGIADVVGVRDFCVVHCKRVLSAVEEIIKEIGSDEMFGEELAFDSAVLEFGPTVSPSPFIQSVPDEVIQAWFPSDNPDR